MGIHGNQNLYGESNSIKEHSYNTILSQDISVNLIENNKSEIGSSVRNKPIITKLQGKNIPASLNGEKKERYR